MVSAAVELNGFYSGASFDNVVVLQLEPKLRSPPGAEHNLVVSGPNVVRNINDITLQEDIFEVPGHNKLVITITIFIIIKVQERGVVVRAFGWTGAVSGSNLSKLTNVGTLSKSFIPSLVV